MNAQPSRILFTIGYSLLAVSPALLHSHPKRTVDSDALSEAYAQEEAELNFFEEEELSASDWEQEPFYDGEFADEALCDAQEQIQNDLSKEAPSPPRKTTFSSTKANLSKIADSGEMPPEKPQPRMASLVLSDSRITIGGNYTRAYIKPFHEPTFSGNLGGMQALYEYRPKNRIYGGMKLAWRQSPTHSSHGRCYLTDLNLEERIGYTFALGEDKWMLSLFSGFGYRALRQKLHLHGFSPIKFYYDEFYIPVGLFTDYKIGTVSSIGLHITWMPQVYPTLRIPSLHGSRWATDDTIENFLAELPMTFTISRNRRTTLTLSPFFEYWKDGRTTAKIAHISLGIPGNTYVFFGGDLNLNYVF